MADVTVEIGGREYDVACQDGEEEFLKSAAKLLDAEASSFIAQAGHMPADRMLLMAGLILADKFASLETKLKRVQEASAEHEEHLKTLQEQVKQRGEAAGEGEAGDAPATAATTPELPAELLQGLEELVTKAEAMAAELNDEVDEQSPQKSAATETEEKRDDR